MGRSPTGLKVSFFYNYFDSLHVMTWEVLWGSDEPFEAGACSDNMLFPVKACVGFALLDEIGTFGFSPQPELCWGLRTGIPGPK